MSTREDISKIKKLCRQIQKAEKINADAGMRLISTWPLELEIKDIMEKDDTYQLAY